MTRAVQVPGIEPARISNTLPQVVQAGGPELARVSPTLCRGRAHSGFRVLAQHNLSPRIHIVMACPLGIPTAGTELVGRKECRFLRRHLGWFLSRFLRRLFRRFLGRFFRRILGTVRSRANGIPFSGKIQEISGIFPFARE